MGGYPLDMTFPVGEASIYYYAPFVWSDGGNLVSEDGLSVDGFSIQMRWRRRWTFSGLWWTKNICQRLQSNICLKAEGLPLRLTGPGRSTRSTKITGHPVRGGTLCGGRRLGRGTLYAYRILGLCRLLQYKKPGRGYGTGEVDERCGKRDKDLGVVKDLPLHL